MEGIEALLQGLQGPIQSVLDGIRDTWAETRKQEPLANVIRGWAHAINWQEPCIAGLLALHLLLLAIALATRRRGGLQAALFMLASAVVFMGEQLNKLGRRHWAAFATQNYFDPNGIFFTTLVSGPLLLLLFIILCNYLLSCTQLLIQAKRRELKARARQQRLEEQGGGQQVGGEGGVSSGKQQQGRGGGEEKGEKKKL